MNPVFKAGMIILPSEVNGREDIRKALANVLTPPEARRFQELHNLGYDSETAAELSGARNLDIESEAAIRLNSASFEDIRPPVLYETARSAGYEVPAAMRSVGMTAGAAAGSAMGMAGVRFVAQNARWFGIGAAVVGVTIATVFTGKIVAAAFGKTIAGVAVANVISAAGIITAAILTRR